jgi:membrane-associated phospholipid phosphatase
MQKQTLHGFINHMVKNFQKVRLFFLLAIIYFLLGGAVLLIIQKGEITLFVNQYHNAFFDTTFIFLTYIGEGWFTVSVIGLLFFHRVYSGLVVGSTMIVIGLVVQFFKRIMFSDYLRPSAFFDPQLDLYYIDGYEIHSMYSFPSGHTTSAFALFMLLSFIFKKKNLQILFFFIALLVGISRIYLVQHFFIDTYFGAFLGMSIAFISYCIFDNYVSLKEDSVLNKPLHKIFTGKNENTARIY